MTVKELKDLLNTMDENKEVIICATTDYQGGVFCDLDDVYEDNVTLSRTEVVGASTVTGPVNENYVILSGFEI